MCVEKSGIFFIHPNNFLVNSCVTLLKYSHFIQLLLQIYSFDSIRSHQKIFFLQRFLRLVLKLHNISNR